MPEVGVSSSTERDMLGSASQIDWVSQLKKKCVMIVSSDRTAMSDRRKKKVRVEHGRGVYNSIGFSASSPSPNDGVLRD